MARVQASAAREPSATYRGGWGRPGQGPKDGCSDLAGALLRVNAHGLSLTVPVHSSTFQLLQHQNTIAEPLPREINVAVLMALGDFLRPLTGACRFSLVPTDPLASGGPVRVVAAGGGAAHPRNTAREGPIRDPGRPHPAASGSRLPRAERREAPQAQSSAAAPSQHNGWGLPGMGPKDSCSVAIGALLYLGAHSPAPSSQAHLGLAAVSSSGARLRGPGLGARDREGLIHHGVTSGEGPVPDRRRPNPATHSLRLPRAERREAQQA
ncbi:hypothetical protein NDU88_005186 [Pleurodeles waltl]|uniref:Uncharacterized protein n=1 Tax=Pleurodeles waltl TaxID=8319 RepID=A0AAV7NLQ8_PLEWA|nr:hypothetical protein NDU88_005186 [Pleurodeles waltl]